MRRECPCRPLCSLISMPRALVSAFLVLFCLLCSSVSSSSRPAAVSKFLSTPPLPQLKGNNYSTDHLALLAIRSAIASDPTGAMSSWNDSSHFCRWRGVECTSTGHPSPLRVVGLHLPSLGLLGSIHASVTNLTFLRTLDLSNNSFQGHIPGELCHELPHLRLLNLSMNSLKGQIPATIGHCSEAWYISFRQNSLTGAIPPLLGNLSSLQKLNLLGNQLTGGIPPQLGSAAALTTVSLEDNNLIGSIPPSVGNLTRLDFLDFGENFLSGTIPPTLGGLDSLTYFSVDTNGFSGTFPSSISNLSSLTDLYLGGNQFSGTLPPNIGALFPNLQFLSLSGNRFHGVIPSSIANASSLRLIQMDVNAFNGVVPSTLGNMGDLAKLLLGGNRLEAQSKEDWGFLTSLGNCTHLKSLGVENNRLGGALPEAVSNLSKSLGWLGLHGNLISGRIPQGIGDLVGLTVLSLGHNLIEGSIPHTIGMLRELGSLFLRNNHLSGQIPASIFNLTRMSILSLYMNQLEGALSSSFGNMQNLQQVYLSTNKFGGTIPKELLSISALTFLDLSENSLSGILPEEIRQLKNINKLDISWNNLSGEIPNSMGDCELLVYLHIQGNNFQGKIPQSINKLRGLESLDFSSNNLSGNIPGFLQEFRYLSYLNLSFNDFDSEAPKGGVFQNASVVSLQGNPKLCGGNLQFHLYPCSRGSESKRPLRRALVIAAITTPSVFLCIIVVIILCVVFLRRSRRRSSPILVVQNPEDMLPRVTYRELFKATDGFSPRNLIGTGSFGSVYEGKMDPILTDPTINGRPSVAVKVINLRQHGATKSFMRECEALRSIRHRNLVKILTSCSSIDFHGNDFKALVFELMPNGSLEQWLHPREDDDNCEKPRLGLGQRLNIAADVALAISYLHSHNPRPIVHRDLKPSNVLLDGEMVAHVSDFGLARFLPNRYDSSENLTSSLAFKGSIGYVAPEYGMGCNASTEGDVYGYGILLLEMVTGRRPTDAMFVGDLTLHKYVQMAFPDRVLDVVDSSLLREGTSSPESMNENLIKEEARVACLASMLRMGLTCSKDSSKERIEMEAVTKEMTTLRERFSN